jgi:hypothetical protein
MMLGTSGKARLFALFALAILSSAPRARANINDYEFRVVETQFKTGQAIVSVRLVHKPDDKPAPDALIFATRLDMAPDGMESMTSMIEPAPSPAPGLYRFKVDLTDAGTWRISLAAKVQGESGTLQGRLILKVAS